MTSLHFLLENSSIFIKPIYFCGWLSKMSLRYKQKTPCFCRTLTMLLENMSSFHGEFVEMKEKQTIKNTRAIKKPLNAIVHTRCKPMLEFV